MKKENKCLVTEKCRFLWWKWTEKYHRHDWAYKNAKERVCLKCGQKEIYFGIYYGDGYSEEDWRKKYKK